MIVADTSALVSLASGDVMALLVEEFEVHTTDLVIAELESTAEYDDRSGRAAETVLDCRDELGVHSVADSSIDTARIDAGEASCLTLVREIDAGMILTDDHRALPELQAMAPVEVVTSPIVLKALVERNALDRQDALDRLDTIAADRSWLDTPIYRHARGLFRD
ncbi:hypothetical protein [Halococcoides cellulosivorans]|uniref:Nucleic acid-binding protein n=1 Tax=Halococcoides cellulosivorans TaxID=1679096 RepID=A0A2R4X1G8_9EURY|nr:hypothetical protein [Halococcoides cellulosivorans]AWB27573.1 hypothetical protein HARCEL1_07545 [Halococcoides cellulosivorans]